MTRNAWRSHPYAVGAGLVLVLAIIAAAIA